MTRTEKDSMGEIAVPQDALYGAQTQRAVNNFPLSGLQMPRNFIRALGLIKAACAKTNTKLGHLDANKAAAIVKAATAVADGEYDQHFPVDVFQTGSGTSSNMNANEVIATLASLDSALSIHPNDHVNRGQSSNDVIPTAIALSASLSVHEQLLPALTHLSKTIASKAKSLSHVTKTGRTHLMDAMPVRFDQELGAWQAQCEHAQQAIESATTRLMALPQGGTAVGSGINADPKFGALFAETLAQELKLSFSTLSNYFEGIASQDSAVALSGQCRNLAVALMKISNDLRWMNSGPLAGLGEIQLPALQPGSSIMPGKVNPVIPEALCMICAQVMGNDTTIAVAGQSGNFQLNVMLPVIGYNLLQSIEILANGCRVLADKAIAGFEVNESQINSALARNPILVTALNAVIGYEKGAAIAKTAYQQQRSVLEVALEMTDLSESQLKDILDPSQLTRGGIPATS